MPGPRLYLKIVMDNMNCEFCNLNDTFDAIDVALLFRK